MSPRHVVVTGAAGGIGLAVAEAFAARGDTVTGVDARGDELRAATALTHRLVADLGDERCAEVIEQAARQGGRSTSWSTPRASTPRHRSTP